MFIAVLFIIAKTWRQPWYPLGGKWINKLWYIHTMEYYLALRRNELPSYEKTQRNLKCILLSERIQPQKTTYCMIPTIWWFGKGKTIETINRLGSQRLRGREEENIFRAVKEFCMILSWWLHIITHLSKCSEYTKLRVKVSYGFEVKLSQSLKELEYVNFLHHFWFPSWLC